MQLALDLGTLETLSDPAQPFDSVLNLARVTWVDYAPRATFTDYQSGQVVPVALRLIYQPNDLLVERLSFLAWLDAWRAVATSPESFAREVYDAIWTCIHPQSLSLEIHCDLPAEEGLLTLFLD